MWVVTLGYIHFNTVERTHNRVFSPLRFPFCSQQSRNMKAMFKNSLHSPNLERDRAIKDLQTHTHRNLSSLLINSANKLTHHTNLLKYTHCPQINTRSMNVSFVWRCVTVCVESLNLGRSKWIDISACYLILESCSTAVYVYRFCFLLTADQFGRVFCRKATLCADF